MQIKKLYAENIKRTAENEIVLKYYITERGIGEGYCGLKSYGIQIERVLLPSGGGRNEDSRLIDDVFFRKSDAEAFARTLSEKRVMPSELKAVIDDYVERTILMRNDKSA